MIIIDLENPDSTCYQEFNNERTIIYYASTLRRLDPIMVIEKQEPTWPQCRKDKRKNFNLK